MHTIVLSGGTADFNTHRTVMSGNGSYTADADTNGYSLGALYEIGYTTVLSKDSRSVMQYVFNVEARYNSIDGFTESGSDAGLVVDDMDSMTVTFGLGARLQSLFGGKVYNRSALFEARFLVKADAGDRRASSTAPTPPIWSARRSASWVWSWARVLRCRSGPLRPQAPSSSTAASSSARDGPVLTQRWATESASEEADSVAYLRCTIYDVRFDVRAPSGAGDGGARAEEEGGSMGR